MQLFLCEFLYENIEVGDLYEARFFYYVLSFMYIANKYVGGMNSLDYS